MATTSSTSTVDTLSTFFTGLINDLMAIERQPRDRLVQQRDEINVVSGAYTDMDSKLNALQSKVKGLESSATSYPLSESRKTSVSNTPSGSTVLTASADSSAAVGSYSISVITLARQHRVWSNQQAAADQALNISGSFTINGTQIQVSADDTLETIAANINDASFESGKSVSASIIDNRLVITADSSGTDAELTVTDGDNILQNLGILDGSGSFVAANQQIAQDAVFTVNGVSVTRSSNTDLADVINGVTLNLEADAEGKDATLTISQDWSSARSAIESFLSEFNSVQTYIQAKTLVEVDKTGSETTYTRGTLASDNIFKELRSDMYFNFITDYENEGSFNNLRQIGITVDDNLNASIEDYDKFEAALEADPESVTALMDQVMSRFESQLGRFTGTSDETGYLDSAIASYKNQVSDINSQISDLDVRLAGKQEALATQYANMQSQLMSLAYSLQMWQSIYGTTNTLA